MNIAIIADDLTGASDTGVQLAMQGIATIVPFSIDDIEAEIANYEAIVWDTDSRADVKEIAYEKVSFYSKRLLRSRPRLVYKKIDSTLRGNIGTELDAIYDVMQPDIIVIAPTFPDTARVVKEGELYVNQIRLHHTETARDVLTPVTTSNICELITRQSAQPVGLITMKQLQGQAEDVIDLVKQLHQKGMPYIVFDAETDEHLERIVSIVEQSGLRVLWCGSAGLIKAIVSSSSYKSYQQAEIIPIVEGKAKPLIVVGSVHARTRHQIVQLMQHEHICQLQLDITKLHSEEERQNEFNRILAEYKQSGHNARAVVLITAGLIEQKQTSQLIAEALGECAKQLIDDGRFSRLIMTGGDTAKQVCTQLNCVGMELLYEVESGMPLSKLIGEREIYAITKSGGFGDEHTLIRLLRFLEGKE